MDWIFAIFFVIIILLRGISWLMQQLKGSEQARMPGQSAPASQQQQGETPMQSVMRMLEEASQEEASREEQRRAQAQPRPKPRRAEPPVLRAKPVPQTGAERHLQSTIGERHLGTRRGSDRLTGMDRREKKAKEITFWERLESYTPLQRAMILHEVLGPPRSSQITLRGRSKRAQAF